LRAASLRWSVLFEHIARWLLIDFEGRSQLMGCFCRGRQLAGLHKQSCLAAFRMVMHGTPDLCRALITPSEVYLSRIEHVPAYPPKEILLGSPTLHVGVVAGGWLWKPITTYLPFDRHRRADEASTSPTSSCRTDVAAHVHFQHRVYIKFQVVGMV
jgi:hypothetical protein